MCEKRIQPGDAMLNKNIIVFLYVFFVSVLIAATRRCSTSRLRASMHSHSKPRFSHSKPHSCSARRFFRYLFRRLYPLRPHFVCVGARVSAECIMPRATSVCDICGTSSSCKTAASRRKVGRRGRQKKNRLKNKHDSVSVRGRCF